MSWNCGNSPSGNSVTVPFFSTPKLAGPSYSEIGTLHQYEKLSSIHPRLSPDAIAENNEIPKSLSAFATLTDNNIMVMKIKPNIFFIVFFIINAPFQTQKGGIPPFAFYFVCSTAASRICLYAQ